MFALVPVLPIPLRIKLPIPLVLPPITTAVAEDASDTSVPPSVIGAPPGTSVCPETIYCVWAFAVITEPPIVITVGVSVAAGVATGGIKVVTLPMTIAVAEGAREIGTEEIIMADPPGTRV